MGKYPANGWGFHDMHGNVSEWCADWYGDYPTGAARDPVGPAVGSYRASTRWFLVQLGEQRPFRVSALGRARLQLLQPGLPPQSPTGQQVAERGLREPPSRGGACAGSDRNRTERRFFFPNPSSLSAVANAWVSPANQDLPQYSGRTRQPHGKETECSYIESPLSRDAPAEEVVEIFVPQEWLPENRRKEAIKTLNLSSEGITSPIIANSQTPLSNT